MALKVIDLEDVYVSWTSCLLDITHATLHLRISFGRCR